MADYSKLDRPEVLSHIFYPQKQERNSPPDGGLDFDCKLDDGAILGCRFYPSATDAPTIIFFHGNAETVSDYDAVAQKYIEHGMNLFMTTYRGYGWSSGVPTVTDMYLDAEVVYREIRHWLAENNYQEPVFLMGRSLGSTGAIDLAEKVEKDIKGLIIESGFSDTAPLADNLGIVIDGTDIKEEDCFNNCEKIAKVKVPTLILHGARDQMIPIPLAERLQACSGARSKQFMVIPGAEHNTMIETAGDLYFQAIKNFTNKVCGKTAWGYKRRKYKQKRNVQE